VVDENGKSVNKAEALATVSAETLDELSRFAERIIRKMARNLHAAQPLAGRDVVHTAILKALNAERALTEGHAAVINGRIQLTKLAKADPRTAEQYSDGLRYWDEMRHDLNGFLRLVILSDIRAWAKQCACGSSLTVEISDDVAASWSPTEGAATIKCDAQSPEEAVGRRLAIESFVNSLDSCELSEIAEQILLEGAQIPDLMFQYGLTRSQVEKRIHKIMETAHQFSRPLKN
jgi:hypothetical protein